MRFSDNKQLRITQNQFFLIAILIFTLKSVTKYERYNPDIKRGFQFLKNLNIYFFLKRDNDKNWEMKA